MSIGKFFTLSTLALWSLAAVSNAASINEIRIDQGGGDDSEYFELAGTPGEDVSGLTYLVIGDGDDGTIEAVYTLPAATLIPADGFLLVAETSFQNGGGEVFDGIIPDLDAGTALNFENSDNVTHLLVSGFTGASGDDLDTDNDGVLDTTPWTSIIDGVALAEELNPPSSTEYHYGDSLGLPVVGPDGIFVPGHAYRAPNGNGPWRIGGFDVGTNDTPGTANVPEPSSILLFGLVGTALAAAGMRRNLG